VVKLKLIYGIAPKKLIQIRYIGKTGTAIIMNDKSLNPERFEPQQPINPPVINHQHNANIDSSDSAMNPHNDNNQSNSTLSSSERFELLSAYVDGEVTAAERRQVESWLATDVKVQQMHRRMLGLRQGFRTMTVPEPTRPVEPMIEQVFATVEARRSRFRVLTGGGAMAAAAAMVAAIVGLNTIGKAPAPQMAKNSVNPAPVESVAPDTEIASIVGLQVELDENALGMVAKTAVVNDGKSSDKNIGAKEIYR
jgi:hypothetical protein